MRQVKHPKMTTIAELAIGSAVLPSTIADGCERLCNVERTHPQPPGKESKQEFRRINFGFRSWYHTWSYRPCLCIDLELILCIRVTGQRFELEVFFSCAVGSFFRINSGSNSFFSGVVIGNPRGGGMKSKFNSTGCSLAAVCGQHTSFPRQWVSIRWHLLAVVVCLARSVVIYRRAASQGVRHQLMESQQSLLRRVGKSITR